MTNPNITVARLEELTRDGSAIKVVDRITHGEYEWKTMRYFCDFADAENGTGWIVSKTEPRTGHIPEPPSILQQIINIVDAGRAIEANGGAKDARRDLAAYSAIIDLLKSEGLIA